MPKDEKSTSADVSGAGLDIAGLRPNPAASVRNLLFLLGSYLLVVGIAFGAFRKTLDVGFLLDDYKHIGYAYNALNGNPAEFLSTFTGNWSGVTDGLTSFRPGTSVTFIIDFLLYGFNSVGYHITNILVFSACAMLTGLIAFQLTADTSSKQRFATGFVAVLLFVAYPIHAESVAWVIGRVDVFCTFFYLFALSLYLHHRRGAHGVVLALSLLSFLCSLLCKEMAVTLPAVIACAELCLVKPLAWRKITAKRRVITVATFFVALICFGVLRTALLGTLVGGYGNANIKSFFRALKNFIDEPTFNKILFGVNEEQEFSKQISTLAVPWAWCGVSLAALSRLCQPTARLRILLFPLLWLALAELPAFQIWHIFPNLVGSRLFFMGSSALCVFLAVALTPNFKLIPQLVKISLAKPGAYIFHSLGLVSLMVLCYCWYLALQHNLYPWSEAGRQVQVLKAQLKEEVLSLAPGTKIVLLDLPQDFSGSGIIGRPEYLESMLDLTVFERNYPGGIVTLARPIPGPLDYVYPQMIASVYGDERTAKCFRWDKDKGAFVQWHMPEGLKSLALQSSPDEVVENPKSQKFVWFARDSEIDPIAVACLQLKVRGVTEEELRNVARNARLVWRSSNQPRSWIDYSEGPFAEVRDNKLIFLPGRSKNWAVNGPIKDLGILFYPGEYKVSLDLLNSVPTESLIPSVKLELLNPASSHEVKPVSSLDDVIVPTVKDGDGVKVCFDASGIEKARGVSVIVMGANIAAPEYPTSAIADESQVLVKKRLDVKRGELELGPEVLKSKGKHQIVVLALDESNQPAGYTSEPRTIFVK